MVGPGRLVKLCKPSQCSEVSGFVYIYIHMLELAPWFGATTPCFGTWTVWTDVPSVRHHGP